MTSPPPPDATFLALQEALVGRYSLERELGRGGMGIVYLAQDVALDRPVALKLLPPSLAGQPILRERFLREARTAAKLSHPHIVPIHQVHEVGDFVFFVMSFVEGETLGQRLRARGPIPPREAARILRDVAWALAYAHGQGVVHRDIKPDNILLEARSGRALVSDFGIAQATAGASSASGEASGTPEYMSPEQSGGTEVDGRSDLYALGAVAYQVVSGRLPVEGPTPQAILAKKLTVPAPPLLSVAPETPAPLAGAVDRCLERDPARRVQSGAELADLLGQVLRDRREIPAAIRLFQEQSRESTGGLALMAIIWCMMAAMLFLVVVEGGEPLADLLPGLLMLGLLSALPAAMLGAMARNLLRAGYGHDELVRALRRDLEEYRREITSQAGGETALDVWAPRVGWGGAFLFGAGMLGIPFPGVPIPLIELLMAAGMPLALLGAGTAAIRGVLRKAVPGTRWLTFWESPPGKGLFAMAGLGVERRGGLAGAYRPTELAIGMAAERLYEGLPKEVRRSLGDVPSVVRQLEGHAEAVRARVAELDEMLSQLSADGAKPMEGGGSESAGRGAGAEVRLAREAAAERLRRIVAALESLRLELLRLHAGSGAVENLTLDLAAARDLSRDIGHRAEGQMEVDRLLGLPSGLPETADTPA